MTTFEIDATTARVAARAVRYVPFEAKGEQRLLRDALRTAIAGLVVGPDDVLAAVFAGTRPAKADAENILLYNIDMGGRIFDRGRGVRFEADVAAPGGWPVAYTYLPLPHDAGYLGWRPKERIASWGPISIPQGPVDRLLASVWLAMRRSLTVYAEGRVTGAVAVDLRLGLPGRPGHPMVRHLKGSIDGVVSALTRDEESSDDAVRRLASQLQLEPATIRDLLRTAPPVFGSSRLLVTRGEGVQWLPPDDLLVAGSLCRADAPTGEMILSGEIVSIELR